MTSATDSYIVSSIYRSSTEGIFSIRYFLKMGLHIRRAFMRYLFALCLGVILSACAEAPAWQSFSSGDFPAQVREIRFSDGSVISNSHSLTFGAWRVAFGTEMPTMNGINKYSSGTVQVSTGVTNLSCHNTAAGTVPCLILLTVIQDKPMCRLAPEGMGTNALNNNFGIECPSDIVLSH